METLIEMAEIVYDGTSDSDGTEMRDLLAIYCASRLGSGACTLGSASKGWWTAAERESLSNSKVEFIATVFRSVPSPKLDAGSFMKQHFQKA